MDAYKLYTLYLLAEWTSDLEYEAIDEKKQYLSYGTYSFHMNWGWEGLSDGWFLDGDVSSGFGNFSKNRKEIIINGYK